MLVVLRQAGVHQIPGLSVGSKNIVFGAKPAGVIEARGGNTDPGQSPGCLAARDARSAIGAESEFIWVALAANGIREMITELAFRQFECLGRHDHNGDIRAAGHHLAGPAVAVEHGQRLRARFVADPPADTPSAKWSSRVHSTGASC